MQDYIVIRLRKVIKISGKVLSAAILLLIILPVGLSLLLDIPAVQNYAVHRVAEAVSRKLGTTVRVGRVDIGLFSKIRVEEFYVADYNRDTLLYVGRLDTYITNFGIFGGGLELRSGEIDDAKLHLHQMSDGEMNIRQIVMRLTNPDRGAAGESSASRKKRPRSATWRFASIARNTATANMASTFPTSI